MRRWFATLVAAVLAMAAVVPGWALGDAPTFGKERLDQLRAPIALDPDSVVPGGNAQARAMQRFDPGPAWEPVQEPSQLAAKGSLK